MKRTGVLVNSVVASALLSSCLSTTMPSPTPGQPKEPPFSPTPVPSDFGGPPCLSTELVVSLTSSGGGAGTVGGYLRFENTGAGRCVVSGWPSIAGVLDSGAEISALPSNSVLTFPAIDEAPHVLLEPGASAFAAYAGSDQSPSGDLCPPYVRLRVAAPGSPDTTVLPAFNTWLGRNLPACGPLQVTMVVAETELDFLEPLRP